MSINIPSAITHHETVATCAQREKLHEVNKKHLQLKSNCDYVTANSITYLDQLDEGGHVQDVTHEATGAIGKRGNFEKQAQHAKRPL